MTLGLDPGCDTGDFKKSLGFISRLLEQDSVIVVVIILLTNQEVRMRIRILQSTITGTTVYVERQTATTNINGLVSIAIGSGTSLDDFSTIDWSVGSYFIKTAIDPSGGSSYTITGTSQILSVPFAMYAKTSGSSDGNATNITSNTKDIATNTTVIAANTLKVGYTDDLVSTNTVVAANTAKEGITLEQVGDISANNDKVVITENDSDSCATSKGGFPSGEKIYLTNEEEDENNSWSLNFENGQFVATTKTMSFKMRYYGSFSGNSTNSAASAILTVGTEQTFQN